MVITLREFQLPNKATMINRIIIVCVLAFAGCVDSISACLDNHISRIAIKKMGWDVLTSKNIDCWEFDELKIPSTMVCDSFMVHKILNSLSKLEPIDKTYIDVRCKLFLYSSDCIVKSADVERRAAWPIPEQSSPTRNL
jgi:hypothetical protein